MFFSRVDKIQTKGFQLPTVFLHAMPRDIICRDCAVLRMTNTAYSVDLFKEKVSEVSEGEDEMA